MCLQLNTALGPQMKFMGVTLNADAATSWVGAAVLLLAGSVLFEFTRRGFARKWSTIQSEIETEIQRRDAAA